MAGLLGGACRTPDVAGGGGVDHPGGGVLLWNLHQAREFVLELARNEANLSFEKDLAYRLWAAKHGGVYVPATPESPPNPYLSQVPERDIQTPSGRALTLVNPAYMTRQVHELTAQLYGSRGHLTSLKPLRPENAPDAWETKALEAFEGGRAEVVEASQSGRPAVSAPHAALADGADLPQVPRRPGLPSGGYPGRHQRRGSVAAVFGRNQDSDPKLAGGSRADLAFGSGRHLRGRSAHPKTFAGAPAGGSGTGRNPQAEGRGPGPTGTPGLLSAVKSQPGTGN